ncbi:MAG TPA: hypothetical protein GYA08_20235 [Chloroflexi bacterium]|nr:hypothetical protein [Chloroflexota bacterium]
MNRQDIQAVQAISAYPSLTITLPTHRTAPDNQQDPIRVRNLVAQARDQLRAEFSHREIAALLERLERLTANIDYRHALDGLVIFVNTDFDAKFYLPFTVPERVVVADRFLTRDLVFAMNRTLRYWVLALSEQPTRLFEGTLDTLVEIQSGGFPMTHEGPGGAAPLPGGFGINPSAHRDERHRQFFRSVDAALKPFLAQDPLPLGVVGVDRYLAFWDEVTTHKEFIRAILQGNYDQASPHELAKAIWPLIEKAQTERVQRHLNELDGYVSQGRVAATVGEAWRKAHEGRGKLLLVEKDYHEAGRLDETGLLLLPANDPNAPDVIPDAVDEVIETVLSKGGEVVFTENGQLADYQRIALILRY